MDEETNHNERMETIWLYVWMKIMFRIKIIDILKVHIECDTCTLLFLIWGSGNLIEIVKRF